VTDNNSEIQHTQLLHAHTFITADTEHNVMYCLLHEADNNFEIVPTQLLHAHTCITADTEHNVMYCLLYQDSNCLSPYPLFVFLLSSHPHVALS